MLGWRRSRWANIRPSLAERLLFVVYIYFPTNTDHKSKVL